MSNLVDFEKLNQYYDKEIERIKVCIDDPKIAHSLEDDLYLDFIKQVAKSNSEFSALAKKLLKVSKLEFPRWYS